MNLYQACTVRRGQAPWILDSKGSKKASKTIKTKPNYPGKYIEGFYNQPRERVTHLPDLFLCFDNDATHTLKGVDK